MNKLRLIKYDTNLIVYQYTPEDDGEPGEIVFDIPSGQVAVEKRAQNDEFGSYGHKAANRVAEYAKKRNLPMDAAVQAWY